MEQLGLELQCWVWNLSAGPLSWVLAGALCDAPTEQGTSLISPFLLSSHPGRSWSYCSWAFLTAWHSLSYPLVTACVRDDILCLLSWIQGIPTLFKVLSTWQGVPFPGKNHPECFSADSPELCPVEFLFSFVLLWFVQKYPGLKNPSLPLYSALQTSGGIFSLLDL